MEKAGLSSSARAAAAVAFRIPEWSSSGDCDRCRGANTGAVANWRPEPGVKVQLKRTAVQPRKVRCRKLPVASSVQDPTATAAAWRSVVDPWGLVVRIAASEQGRREGKSK